MSSQKNLILIPDYFNKKIGQKIKYTIFQVEA